MRHLKIWFFIIGFLCTAALITSFLRNKNVKKSNKECVYIYNWADYIPEDILEDFEKETHIHPVYDSFESVEILEAKLLVNSGYDVVFPPAWPVFANGITMQLFLGLNKDLIPNAKNLNAELVGKLSSIDPELKYGLPYLWGTTGLGYDIKAIKNRLPNVNLNSWGLIFNPNIIKNFVSCRPHLLDSAMDVFQAALLYLGESPSTLDKSKWDKAIEVVKAIRPYISAFDGSRQIQTLVDGQSQIIQGYSTYINMARSDGKNLSIPKDIGYTIPEEGSVIWFDMMAIPRNAPHPKNAHIFINFILKPSVIARITNKIRAANAVDASRPFVDKELLADTIIYPDAKMMERIHSDFLPPLSLSRYLLRQWLKIKMGHVF